VGQIRTFLKGGCPGDPFVLSLRLDRLHHPTQPYAYLDLLDVGYPLYAKSTGYTLQNNYGVLVENVRLITMGGYSGSVQVDSVLMAFMRDALCGKSRLTSLFMVQSSKGEASEEVRKAFEFVSALAAITSYYVQDGFDLRREELHQQATHYQQAYTQIKEQADGLTRQYEERGVRLAELEATCAAHVVHAEELTSTVKAHTKRIQELTTELDMQGGENTLQLSTLVTQLADYKFRMHEMETSLTFSRDQLELTKLTRDNSVELLETVKKAERELKMLVYDQQEQITQLQGQLMAIKDKARSHEAMEVDHGAKVSQWQEKITRLERELEEAKDQEQVTQLQQENDRLRNQLEQATETLASQGIISELDDLDMEEAMAELKAEEESTYRESARPPRRVSKAALSGSDYDQPSKPKARKRQSKTVSKPKARARPPKAVKAAEAESEHEEPQPEHNENESEHEEPEHKKVETERESKARGKRPKAVKTEPSEHTEALSEQDEPQSQPEQTVESEHDEPQSQPEPKAKARAKRPKEEEEKAVKKPRASKAKSTAHKETQPPPASPPKKRKLQIKKSPTKLPQLSTTQVQRKNLHTKAPVLISFNRLKQPDKST
jgi:hypothetical protein